MQVSLEAEEAELVEVAAADGCEVWLLRDVAEAFASMQAAADADGIELVAVSGYRSIARQCEIWDRKMSAARGDGLSVEAALARVMEYSAPPGWSRHHWGSEIDLVSGALRNEARLEVEDWEEEGVCAEAGRWLQARAAGFGFLRPYDADRGGYRVEPWHFSYAPVSLLRLRALQGVDWGVWMAEQRFAGADSLAPRASREFERFGLGIQPALLGLAEDLPIVENT